MNTLPFSLSGGHHTHGLTANTGSESARAAAGDISAAYAAAVQKQAAKGPAAALPTAAGKG